ncbi:helix-turn-helix domain-containing protein [Oscillibacter sp.]|uniref:helix-turn-helix domain-containing protein n=1 Tax=Oscillibacter sp. TaxID=1945593 RepID=UPI001B60F2BA|nr:helix-turn-helix transcriptional regulator [Oscillibacter sp.]MBP3509189.1 helix-turn-helix transcriptional regulator [Oscillibacter sp.]
MQSNLLRGAIIAQGLTMQSAAQKIGISRNSMSARMNGKVPFNADEIEKLCALLDISDPVKKVEIFLT